MSMSALLAAALIISCGRLRSQFHYDHERRVVPYHPSDSVHPHWSVQLFCILWDGHWLTLSVPICYAIVKYYRLQPTVRVPLATLAPVCKTAAEVLEDGLPVKARCHVRDGGGAAASLLSAAAGAAILAAIGAAGGNRGISVLPGAVTGGVIAGLAVVSHRSIPIRWEALHTPEGTLFAFALLIALVGHIPTHKYYRSWQSKEPIGIGPPNGSGTELPTPIAFGCFIFIFHFFARGWRPLTGIPVHSVSAV